jgi:agmatine deiminase
MPSQIKNQKSKIETPADFQTPASLGYAMPPEWAPHEATWIAWPHNHEDWPDKFEPIPWIYAEIVRLIAQSERVHIFVQPSPKGRFAKEVTAILERNDVNLAHVTLHAQPTDRVWTRDSGPIFLQRKLETRNSKLETALADFKFNAWAKYDNNALDDALPTAVADYLELPRFTAYGENDTGELQRFVLEGGSIDVNGGAGGGCVLTTEECLLSEVQQRNPGFSRQKIEQTLHAYLGTSKVLWLDQGIAGDDTHGHVDDTARFTNPTTILTCVAPNKSDLNHAPMKENLKRLKKMRDTQNKQFTIAELPLPSPVVFEGQRLPASYANFYIANTGVLVPVFNDPNDTLALKIIEQLITDRPIIPVYCRDLVWGLGTLHCMTQQQPA